MIRRIGVGSRVAVALTLLGLSLTGCPGGGGSSSGGASGGGGVSGPTGSVSMQVSGTTVIAVGPPPGDQILAEDSSAGKTGPPYTLTLSGLPLNQSVRLFVISDGQLYPILFSGSNNAFQLASTTPFAMGQVTLSTSGGNVQAIVANTPSTVLVSGALTEIPSTIKNPLPPSTLTQGELLEIGEGLFKSGAFQQAKPFFAAAVTKGGAQTDLARFYLAQSRVFGVGTTLYAGSGLGEILTALGCAGGDLQRTSWDVISCPAQPTYPATQIQSFAATDVKGELQSALADLNAITALGSPSVDVPGYGPDGHPAGFDFGDVYFLKGIANATLGLIELQEALNSPAAINTASSPTIQAVLAANPTFLTVGSTSTLAAARTHISDGLDSLTAAVNFIFAETDNQVGDYIDLIGENQSELLANITAYKSSLTGTGTNSDGVTFNFNGLFTAPGISLKPLLPPFTGNDVSGLLPDPSLGGIIVSGANLNQDLNANSIPDIFE
jgi:hypothetical protein